MKGNLVVMNNLYRKFAVASVGIVLTFALGASEEVKAATITFIPTIQFGVYTRYNRLNFPTSNFSAESNHVVSGPFDDTTRVAEFDISSLFLTPNTIISSAVFQDKISNGYGLFGPAILNISGYVGNGTAEVSDGLPGRGILSSVDISSSSPGVPLNFDVTTFVNQRVSNRSAFAGFVIGISAWSGATLEGTDALGRSSLVIETVDAEPVPEPTTIFGSALALAVGGWLKRKKSSRQNKTTSQT